MKASKLLGHDQIQGDCRMLSTPHFIIVWLNQVLTKARKSSESVLAVWCKFAVNSNPKLVLAGVKFFLHHRERGTICGSTTSTPDI
jgi:hypothetical protein